MALNTNQMFRVSPNQGGGTGKFGNPGPSGTSPSNTAGGTDKYLGKFTATAYGPPWGGIQGTGVTADGTELRPARQIYGVAVDPSVIPMGTFLHIQPNPFSHNGTFKAFDTGGAIKGNRIDFYDWRGRATQTKWGRQTVQVYKASSPDAKLDPPAKGSGLPGLPSIPNPLNAVDDMATAVKAFVSFVLSPKSMGELLSKILAYTLKTIAKALWNYVLGPFVHWQQRAVMSYWRNTILEGDAEAGKVPFVGDIIGKSATGIPAFVTLSFWATGYAILWAKLDKERSMMTEPGKTPLGSLIRSFGNTSARRHLVKPKDVKKKTPQKPEPVKSSARIVQVGEMSAERRRTVRVGGNGANDDGLPSGSNSDGRSGTEDTSATGSPDGATAA